MYKALTFKTRERLAGKYFGSFVLVAAVLKDTERNIPREWGGKLKSCRRMRKERNLNWSK